MKKDSGVLGIAGVSLILLRFLGVLVIIALPIYLLYRFIKWIFLD